MHHESHIFICVFNFQDKAYSFESSQELLDKDIVQLHAPRWHPLRRVCSLLEIYECIQVGVCFVKSCKNFDIKLFKVLSKLIFFILYSLMQLTKF